jgi:hypothetical protein
LGSGGAGRRWLEFISRSWIATSMRNFAAVAMIVSLQGNSDSSGNIDKFDKHKVSQVKAVRLRQRECVTHPLLLDSEICDGVPFGRDLARNPLHYVNAWVDQRTLFVGII